MWFRPGGGCFTSQGLMCHRRSRWRWVSFPDLMCHKRFRRRSVFSPDPSCHRRFRRRSASFPDPMHQTQSRMLFRRLPLQASSPVRSSSPENLRFRSIQPAFSVYPSFSFPSQVLPFRLIAQVLLLPIFLQHCTAHQAGTAGTYAQQVSCSTFIIYLNPL